MIKMAPSLFLKAFHVKKKIIFIFVLLLITRSQLPTTIASDQPFKHVVLIAVDCVNPTTLQQSDTPNIDLLIASGSYTFDSCTVTPANTISAIPAIFTGAPQEIHQLYEWTGTMQAESIIEVLEESGYTCAIVGESENLGGYAATYNTGFDNRADFDEYYFDIAVNWLVEYEPFFMFIYNPMPDRAGHQYGLGSEEYQIALETADYHIGRLIETLQDQGVYNETLIIVTTDHSLQGTSHSRDPTFSIWKGPGIKEGYEMDDTSEYVTGFGWVSHTLDDIAPTILDYLGLRPLSDATGEVISSIYQSVSEPEPEFPPPPPLPPVLSDLTVTPAEIVLGANVTIGLDIMNLDSQSFTYIVTMQIGELTLLVDVDLEPYELETVSRTIIPDTVGDYNVTVDGMTGSFEVKPPLPAEFVISGLEATLDEVGLQPWVVFDVVVKNIGETEGTYTVEFKLSEATSQPTSGDGETIDTQNVTLAPGGSHHARAFYFLPRAGTYQVSVGDLTDTFMVLGRGVPLYPAEFEFSNLEITPRVEEGMSVNISVDVTNVGEEMGGCTVELTVNGEMVDSVEIPPFEGGVTATQFFELTRGKGTYEVEVEGLTGSFTVFRPEASFWDKIPGFPYVSIIIGLIVVIIVSGSRARTIRI